MSRRFGTAAALLCIVMTIGAFAAAPRANGQTRVVEPAQQPVDVRYDAQGQPIPFTIKVAGFEPFTQVYIMQCDGVPWGDDLWKPTLDCDVGSAPAPAIAGKDGVAVFGAVDPNHVMKLFRGKSPQEQFNCLAPDDPSPKNRLRDFRDCSLRVSTSNLVRTPDQVKVLLRFPAARTAAKRDGGDSKAPVWLVVSLIVIAIVIVVAVLVRRARSRASAAT